MTDLEEQRGLQAALSELLAGGGWGKVRGVLLCGSRAKGTHHERSDYDLLVVTTKRIRQAGAGGCRAEAGCDAGDGGVLRGGAAAAGVVE